MWYFLTLIVLVLAPYILIVRAFPKNFRDSFWWLVNKGRTRLPFSTTDEYGMGKGFIYCPHPFTNWSLNPSYASSSGEVNHTVEGFRKTENSNSIVEMVKGSPSAYRIACVGGSTTYCTEVARYQDSWPALLKERLGQDVLVFNFGVGGWGTMQSVIRCAAWLPVIRPNVLIFYQAKNDLTPLYNGAKRERAAFPDYQNLMGQFSDFLCLRFPAWLLYIPLFSLIEMMRLRKEHILSLYKRPMAWASPEGLKRLTDELIDGIVFRTEALIGMCGIINCKVLYAPEVVRSGPYADYLDKIYERVSEVMPKHKNAVLYDIGAKMSGSDKYFLDKMHFNKNGCAVFADELAKEIVKLRRDPIYEPA